MYNISHIDIGTYMAHIHVEYPQSYRPQVTRIPCPEVSLSITSLIYKWLTTGMSTRRRKTLLGCRAIDPLLCQYLRGPMVLSSPSTPPDPPLAPTRRCPQAHIWCHKRLLKSALFWAAGGPPTSPLTAPILTHAYKCSRSTSS